MVGGPPVVHQHVQRKEDCIFGSEERGESLKSAPLHRLVTRALYWLSCIAAMLRDATSMVFWCSHIGLNSTTSVSSSMKGRWPGTM
jgi:hypothetical protein